MGGTLEPGTASERLTTESDRRIDLYFYRSPTPITSLASESPQLLCSKADDYRSSKGKRETPFPQDIPTPKHKMTLADDPTQLEAAQNLHLTDSYTQECSLSPTSKQNTILQ